MDKGSFKKVLIIRLSCPFVKFEFVHYKLTSKKFLFDFIRHEIIKSFSTIQHYKIRMLFCPISDISLDSTV